MLNINLVLLALSPIFRAFMGSKKRSHYSLKSLIIVGEGPHDQAFLEHMKSIYDSRFTNQTVKIEAADGGSPRDIINYLIRKRHISFDKKLILMDSDVLLTQQDRDLARRHDITILQSDPVCLEGMLLSIIGESPGVKSEACKKKLHKRLSGLPTLKSSYSALFTKSLLDSTSKSQILQIRSYLLNE